MLKYLKNLRQLSHSCSRITIRISRKNSWLHWFPIFKISLLQWITKEKKKHTVKLKGNCMQVTYEFFHFIYIKYFHDMFWSSWFSLLNTYLSFGCQNTVVNNLNCSYKSINFHCKIINEQCCYLFMGIIKEKSIKT